jgi:hypothetical protein
LLKLARESVIASRLGFTPLLGEDFEAQKPKLAAAI